MPYANFLVKGLQKNDDLPKSPRISKTATHRRQFSCVVHHGDGVTCKVFLLRSIKYRPYSKLLEHVIFCKYFHTIETLINNYYYMNTHEIPGELSRENMISSLERSALLWLHNNKSHLSQ